MRKTRLILAGGSMTVVVIALVGMGWLSSSGVSTAQANNEERPRVPEALKPLAKAASEHYAAGEFEAAAQQYERLLEEDPKSLYAWSNLGVVRYQQKRYDEAVKVLQKALSISPKDAFTWSILGIVYYQKGELAKSEAALQRAIELDPEHARAKAYLEVAREQKSWQEAAIEDMKRKSSFSPLLDAPGDHFIF